MKEIENTKGLAEPDELEGTADEVTEFDALSAEHAPGLSLIVLMRIYEVQMALLREVNPQFAERLLELHGDGIISTPLPYLNPDSL